MRRVRPLFVLSAVLLLLAGGARANDSNAELGAGGLVLVKTDAITMQREDLSLSLSEVRVRYEMRNDTGKPVTLRVAFPMPEVPRDSPAGLHTRTSHNIAAVPWLNANFVNFRVIANGQEVTPEKEVRAVLPNGKDVTAEVLASGGEELLLRPGGFHIDLDGQEEQNPHLDAKTMAHLKTLGALTEDGEFFELVWQASVTFHWMQTFQPGITVLEHTYRPILGRHLVAKADPGGPPKLQFSGAVAEETYCIDDPTRRAVFNMLKKYAPAASATVTVEAFSLAYIVKTARNWSGPIGTFHLSIQGEQGVAEAIIAKNLGWKDTGKAKELGGPGNPEPGDLITSLCTELPIHRTGPLHFEATVKNYVPSEDLNILFVEAISHQP